MDDRLVSEDKQTLGVGADLACRHHFATDRADDLPPVGEMDFFLSSV
jgi:hypothetical protein